MFFRQTEGGVELFVRLTPRGGADRIEGVMRMSGGREYLAARVRAVPEKGAANAALENLLAEALGIPRNSVSVVTGQTTRVKTVLIEGDAVDLSSLVRALAKAPMEEGGKRR